jgi:DNA primase
MHIPDNVVYEVKEKVDILETVRQYVPLKKSGASYIGKCCFHNDSHPSLVVSTQKQIVSCFVCNVSYDAIGFVQALILLGWVLNLIGVIPAFRREVDGWRQLLQQTQQQKLPSIKGAATQGK